jgi:signal transduction histidine kinase/CheY-like chemotaxis protein/PAS domain-containing protein/HPt (histidine-containing phosphotransfer) domain-containing protein
MPLVRQKKHKKIPMIPIGIVAVFMLLSLTALLIMEITGRETIQTGLITLGIFLAVVLIVMTLRISTERNMAEERVRIMFDTMPLGANIHDKNFSYFDCNDSVVNLFGFSNKQDYLDNFFQLSPEYQPDGIRSKEKMNELINKAFTDGYCRFEWIHRKLSGELLPCEITLVRIKQNNEFAITVYIHDLRETKKMMQEMQHRENLLNVVNRVAGVLLSINDERFFKTSLLKSFELVGNCLDVDRVQIWCNEIIDDELHFVLRYKWLSEFGTNTVPVPLGMHFPYRMQPEWGLLFLRGEHINSPLSALPESYRVFLNPFGMKSVVMIPIFLDDIFWGLFYVDDCRQERVFSDEDIQILSSAGLMMSNAIDRNLQNIKIREMDERVRIMFDAMPQSASYIDINYKILDCNEGTVKIFGLATKQEYFDRYNELSPEYQSDGTLSREKIIDVIDKAFVEGYNRYEWMHCNLNGDPIPCEITLIRVKHHNDFVLAAYIRDLREITAAVTQMNQSRQSLKILESILNGLDTNIYITIPQTGEILFINDYMKKHYNVEGDCVGQFCYKIFSKDTNEKCDFCPCHQLDKDPHSTVVWEKRNSVTNRIYRNTDRYMEWPDGRIVHIQHSVDVTELISAKEQAIQASNEKSSFLAKMSHEVRTPMNAIMGITEMQMQNELLSSDMREALDKIYNSGFLLLGIINDILDLSKIETGIVELSPVQYNIADLINDTVNLNLLRYNKKSIEFKLQIDENIPSLLTGDDLRIKQILNNLLSNAFKYTDSGNVTLSISSENTGQKNQIMLVFQVSDTGQGMTTEQINMLFDEYIRFNTDANRTIEGAGLGMNITKYFIGLMNGNISVVSDPGKGSVFTVFLPQVVADNYERLGVDEVENLKQLTGKSSQIKKVPQIVREYMPYGRILVVDDIDTNLYVARGLLAPYALSVETATNGFEVIDKIKNGFSYDIIFMDHYMPKMDGIETTKALREFGYLKPIIALTANALAGMAEMFLDNGFDTFISKPIDIRQLNTALNKFVRDKYPPEVVETARRQAAVLPRSEEPSLSIRELTQIFIKDAEKTIAVLEPIHANNYRRNDDIQMYIIVNHAMKSALANIGEKTLSAVAFNLEQAGREKNIMAMTAGTPVFLDSLRALVERMRPKEEDVKDMSVEDRQFLHEKLHIIQNACTGYDERTAYDSLTELQRKAWPRNVKDILEAIAEELLHSEFNKASEIAKNSIG